DRIDFEQARVRPGINAGAIRRYPARLPVSARTAVVEHEEVAGARQSFGDEVCVMLPDDLPDRARRLRLEEVGPQPPHDLAVARDDGHEARLATADDDVVRRKATVTRVEPAVGP